MPMRTVKVKICGITSEEDLEMVCSLGADAVGFVVGVPNSPRNLSLERAERLIGKVPLFVKSVLVTVTKNLETLLSFYENLKPDIIQIHGETSFKISALREKIPDAILVRGLNVKSKGAIRVAADAAKVFDAVLADSYMAGKHGGTGVTHNWSLSRRIQEAISPKPLILAGGLNAENVKSAVETVKPYAVDVSTGVESKPGVKDPEKVRAFIKNAKNTVLDYG